MMNKMNTALIFAGGTGQRMNTKTKPKQFLELHSKPIIIYTLENFESHPDIDGIVVVCLEGWINYLEKLLNKFNITKVKAIVHGGATGQESIYNGLCKLEELYDGETVVLIHDGVRPLINQQIITDVISCTREKGNAITVSPAIETVALKTADNKVGDIIDRSKIFMAKAPQSFYLDDILAAHRRALNEDIRNAIDSATLMKMYGNDLFSIVGPIENIKITTPSDFYIFRAILDARENSQVFGID